MTPGATWQQFELSPSPVAGALACRMMTGAYSPGAWPLIEGRVFGVCACTIGHAGQLADVLSLAREVRLLVAVALAVGDA